MSLDPITAIVDLVSNVVTGVTQDQKDKLALAIQQNDLAAKSQDAQIAVNTAEATSSSLFVAGWRPMAGWVCTIGLGYNTVGLALIKSIFAFAILFGVDTAHVQAAEAAMPQVDMTLLMSMLTQLLGITSVGTMRTQERIKGVARNNMDENL
jgi:hypothetical protein